MVIISSILSVSLLSAGGLGDFIKNNLNGSIASTNAGYYKSQTRGLWYGGDFKARWNLRRANIKLFHAQAPSYSGNGCNGIDATFGSFSYINLNALVDKLKMLPSAAAAYAFELAISTLCEQCKTIMNNLEKIVNQVNSFNLDACKALDNVASKLRKTLAETGKAQDSLQTNKKAEEDHTWQFTKALESFRQQFNNAVYGSETEGEVGFRNLTGQGSVLNKALDKTYEVTFMDDKDEFLAIMRGLIGDIYGFCKKRVGKKNTKNYMSCSFQKITPSVSVKDFIDFLTKGGDLNVTNIKEKIVTIEGEKFYAPADVIKTKITIPKDNAFIPMFKKKIQTLINKIKGKQNLDNNDKAFINSMPFPLYKYVNIEASLETNMTQESAEYLAYLSVKEFIDQFFMQVKATVGSVLQDPNFSETANEEVKKWVSEATKQYTDLMNLLNSELQQRADVINRRKILVNKYRELEQQMIRLSPLWRAQTL